MENKARFFALYWNQLILMQKNGLGVKRCIQAYWEKTIGSRYLELKSLSDISEEDAVEVARILRYNTNEKIEVKVDHDSLIAIYEDGQAVELYFDFSGYCTYDNYKHIGYSSADGGFSESCYLFFVAMDYLRSKGYALPFMGVSVETMISWNWIKLKK